MLNHPPANFTIAVNTMRARLTVLGFNLAMISFQSDTQSVLQGGVMLPGFSKSVHFSSSTMFLLSAIISIFAMIVFITSGSLSKDGLCEPKTMISGDLMMYLALSQTIAGLLSPYLWALDLQTLKSVDVSGKLVAVRYTMAAFGAAAWIFASYIGPAHSLYRASYGRKVVLLQLCIYLAVLWGQNWLVAQAREFELGELAYKNLITAVVLPPVEW